MGLMTRPPVVGRDGRDSVWARYLLLMRYFCEGAGPGPRGRRPEVALLATPGPGGLGLRGAAALERPS